MTEVEQPPQNGIDLSANEEDESSKARPADIEQDMREMERRKRVEAIMGSKLFREELERIVDSARDSGNTAGILQQLSDIVGGPGSRVANVFKSSNCLLPINDIRGVESMGYAKGEKILRCKLAATFRLLDLYGWTQGLGAQITARLKVDQEYFLVNPYGLLYHEITASSLNKVDMQGHIVEQGTTNFGVNKSHFVLHSAVHAARPDIRCAIYIGCSPVVAISSLKTGLLPITKDACVLGDVTTFSYSGCLLDEEERNKLVRNLGPNSKIMLLTNHGALCCGETIEEAFFAACHIVQACETQLKLLPVGLDNLVLIPEESRKAIYEQSRRPPEDLEKKFANATAVTSGDSNKDEDEAAKKEEGSSEAKTKVLGHPPKWRVGGAEFEALMRMLDNAGYRTGYIYRHPLIKSDPPKPKNDVELPPAVSSLGYLLEEEELFRQGIWKKGVLAKGGDRSRWLNSPNVYQKVEVLETGTPDPKKITKWVAEGSPTHSTPVRIDDPLQFVPVNTNPKEFKRLQQQIKDNRRADKISAGPQSHILEGVTWDEANRIKDATVSQAGDHVVLMGAASKGIIQRGFQHNATVYKAPYAKNPFDNVTDDELNEYKRTVERKKKSIHGEYTDTDFSESEALSSLQTSGAQQQTKQNTTTTTTTAAVSQSEPEDISEHQVMRIQTQQAPVPSQPEVVLSDATLSFINGERSHTAFNRKPPTGRDNDNMNETKTQKSSTQDTLDNFQAPQDGKTMQGYLDKNIGMAKDAENKNACNASNVVQKLKCSQEIESDIVLYEDQNSKIHQHTKTTPPKSHNKHTNTQISISNSTNNPLETECGGGKDKNNNQSSESGPSKTSITSTSSQLDQSLYVNMLSNANQYSYPSYCPLHFVQNSVRGDENISPVYDRLYEGQSSLPNVRVYKMAVHCYTPSVCGEIFENLKKNPTPWQENYLGANSLQDLIWNKPYHRNYSPISVTPEMCYTPPQSMTTPNSSPQSKRKGRSPYRTLSHFGFISPRRDPQPDHKHVPPRDGKKYKPLRRSVSYEEIFSSSRYMELCEQCFEQFVRLKPEILEYRTKLRNLADYRGPWQTMANNSNDLSFESTDSQEPQSVFTTHLEPVMEVEESISSSEPAQICETSFAESSTFIDKISRMNYSHEAREKNHENDENEDPNMGKDHNICDEKLSKELRHLTINGGDKQKVVATHDNQIATPHQLGEMESCVWESKLEIWEYDNWLSGGDQVTIEMSQGNKADDLEDYDVQQANNFAGIPSEIQTGADEEDIELENCSGVSINEGQDDSYQSHINRCERFRRRLEFSNLLGNIMNYCDNEENVLRESNTAVSDTESAMDEDAAAHAAIQPPSNHAIIENANYSECKETFESRSFIFGKQKSRKHLAGGAGGQEEDETEDVNSLSSSQHTFNISEKNASQENLENQPPFHCVGGDAKNFVKDDNDETMVVSDSEEGNLLFRSSASANILADNDNMGGSSSRENMLFRSFGSTNIIADFVLGRNNRQIFQSVGELVSDENDEFLYEQEQAEEDDEIEYSNSSRFSLNDDQDEEANATMKENTKQYERKSKSLESTLKDENLPNNSVTYRQQKKRANKEEASTSISMDADIFHKNEISNNSTFFSLDDDDLSSNNKVYNKENLGLGDADELSNVERKILQKINLHKLNKSEEIFSKIQHSILNKLTPSKLEMRIREQLLLLYSDKDSVPPTEQRDTEDRIIYENLYNPRRCRSLTPTCSYNSFASLDCKNEGLTSPGALQKRRWRSLSSCHRCSPHLGLHFNSEYNLNKSLPPSSGRRSLKQSESCSATAYNQKTRTASASSTMSNNSTGENVQNGDHSEAHLSTFSHSSKEDISTDGSPKKDKKKKKGLRTPSFLKKKKEKKKAEA